MLSMKTSQESLLIKNVNHMFSGITEEQNQTEKTKKKLNQQCEVTSTGRSGVEMHHR